MTGPHPKGGTKWLAAAGGFFGFAMQSRHGRRRKKSPGAVAGRRADLGQTSLARGRIGCGAGQDHGADGMFCGSFAAAGRGVAGDGLVPEAGAAGGFRAGEVQGDVAPAFVSLRSMQRSAAASGGNRREGCGLRFGQAQARPV